MIFTKIIADHKEHNLPTKMICEMIGDYEKSCSTKMIGKQNFPTRMIARKMIARRASYFFEGVIITSNFRGKKLYILWLQKRLEVI